MPKLPYPIKLQRRAVLIFADAIAADLARRALPRAASALFGSPSSRLEGSFEGDVHIFSRATLYRDESRNFHFQRGATFAERLENAIEVLSTFGYEEIVAVGRDCPNLRQSDIALAFEELAKCKLVLGPDHRGGCYLIGFRAADRSLLRGIKWNRNTDCAQLRHRAGESNVSLLAVKNDVDSWADIRILARLSDGISRLAAFLIALAVVAKANQIEQPFNLAAQFVRIRQQIPPPILAHLS